MTPLLVLIDLQRDHLRAANLQPPAGQLIDRAVALLSACRARQVPVVHAWTTLDRTDDRRLRHWRLEGRWACVKGTPGHEPPMPLAPRGDEKVIHKTGYDIFQDAALNELLERGRCDTVILAGVHLHACVRTAAMGCLQRNLAVIVAADATGSHDPIHAAASGRWLAERSVRFQSVDDIIAGLDGLSRNGYVHRSPCDTGKVLWQVPGAEPAQVQAALSAACEAQGAWASVPWSQRAEILHRWATSLEAEADAWARQMAMDIGKPVTQGAEEIRRAVANLRDVARRAQGAQDTDALQAGAGVRWRPLGVVAVITPWNNPVAIPAGKIGPALAYGNVVVWKAAPAATRLAQRLLTTLRQAGVPSGAAVLLAGDGATARTLANDPKVDAVTFTGSNLAGHVMQEICARRMVPLQAELGGNNAAIVWEDADLAGAAREVAWGAFAFAGQRCTANRRVIVAKRCLEPFLEVLVSATRQLAWGDPLEQATAIGPLVSESRRRHVLATIERAQAQGATSRIFVPHADQCGQPQFAAGAYLPPHIMGCDDPEHELVQEETMGPVLVVQQADDFDQALALCNGVRQGLAAALFSRSADLRQRFLTRVQAGVVKINCSTAGVDGCLPFSGWKASGLGPPEHGEGDGLFYRRMQSVYIS